MDIHQQLTSCPIGIGRDNLFPQDTYGIGRLVDTLVSTNVSIFGSVLHKFPSNLNS
jgi:hypothetical protein